MKNKGWGGGGTMMYIVQCRGLCRRGGKEGRSRPEEGSGGGRGRKLTQTVPAHFL